MTTNLKTKLSTVENTAKRVLSGELPPKGLPNLVEFYLRAFKRAQSYQESTARNHLATYTLVEDDRSYTKMVSDYFNVCTNVRTDEIPTKVLEHMLGHFGVDSLKALWKKSYRYSTQILMLYNNNGQSLDKVAEFLGY